MIKPLPVFDAENVKTRLLQTQVTFDVSYRYNDFIKNDKKRELALQIAEIILNEESFCTHGCEGNYDTLTLNCYVLSPREMRDFAKLHYEKGKNSRVGL